MSRKMTIAGIKSMKAAFLIVGLFLLAIPALAQEPQGTIEATETVTRAASHAVTVTLMKGVGDSTPTPTIYPNPLPPLPLGEIARRVRAAHITAPKAVKVVNDETEAPQD